MKQASRHLADFMDDDCAAVSCCACDVERMGLAAMTGDSAVECGPLSLARNRPLSAYGSVNCAEAMRDLITG
jgi:hypothetical protein